MRYTIVGYGNSITEATVQTPDENKRWLNILKRRLENAFPEAGFCVINAGVGGNSDREKLARLEKDVLAHKPDFLLLEFGGNNDDPDNPERRVSREEAGKCLETVKKRVSPETRIIVITFPPLIEEQHIYCGRELFEQAGGLDAYVEIYREQSRAFARKNHFPLVDFARELKAKMEIHGGNTYILPDGVHLTEKGNQELADLVFLTLKEQILKSKELKL